MSHVVFHNNKWVRPLAEHGQYIYIYAHVQTKQVLYSLTRALDNTRALKQLPFLGKKTQPAVLRKDYWRPLAIVCFPYAYQGLCAYQKLRELRKRHEHEWVPVARRTRLQNARAQRDQKANSVADLAAVLISQQPIALEEKRVADRERTQAEKSQRVAQARYNEIVIRRKQLSSTSSTDSAWPEYQALKREKMKLARTIAKLEGLKTLEKPPRFTVEGIRIMWKEVLDAEFAVTWPAAVVHDQLSFGETRYGEKHDAPSPSYHVWPRHGSLAEASGGDIIEGITPTVTRTPEVKVPPSRIQRILDRFRIGTKSLQ